MPRRPRSCRVPGRSALSVGAALLAALASSSARAHGGGGGSGPISLLATHLHSGEVLLGLEVEWSGSAARSDDDPLFRESVRQQALRPFLAFRPTPWLMLAVRPSLARRFWSAQTEGFPPTLQSARGLGDTELAARFSLWSPPQEEGQEQRRPEQALSLVAGATLPTGVNDAQAGGFRLDEHAQVGAGAAAPLVGLLYTVGADRWSGWASAAVRVPLENRYSYRRGWGGVASVRGEFALFSFLSVGAGFELSYTGRDQYLRAPRANTGGLLLVASPGLGVHPAEAISLWLGASLPAARHLFGEQQIQPGFQLAVHFQLE